MIFGDINEMYSHALTVSEDNLETDEEGAGGVGKDYLKFFIPSKFSSYPWFNLSLVF